MHVVCVTFQIAAGKIEEFLPLMHLQARNTIELEPNCHRFDVCQSNTNDHEVFLYEVYTDEAAFAKHLDSVHFKEFDRESAAFFEDNQVANLTLIEPTLPAA